jgi:hypothetical protein
VPLLLVSLLIAPILGTFPLALYPGQAHNLNESGKEDENWKEYQHVDRQLHLKAVDSGKLTKFRNLSISWTLFVPNER